MSVVSCPLPFNDSDVIVLAHGGGGRVMHRLVERIVKNLGEAATPIAGDSAILRDLKGPLAFTVDSFVVSPLSFPGGNIGKLAVCGTANDLAVAGAKPRVLSLSLVLEEGLPLALLDEIIGTIRDEAAAIGVKIVCGDTKVVEKGKGDGVFISTSGIGEVVLDPVPNGTRIAPGDAILVNGDLGRHGIALMALRDGLRLRSTLESDCEAVWPAIAALIAAGVPLNAMRDLTRGGLASALVELSQEGNVDISLEEAAIPIQNEVRGATELLGIDPLHSANEGRFVLFTPAPHAAHALEVLRNFHDTAAIIGAVGAGGGSVSVKTPWGSSRLMSMPAGDQLPRIC